MKRRSRKPGSNANPDRSRTPSKNEILPKSDFFMLIVRTGETEHELPAELAQRIETMIAACYARRG
jgi:hypothetical protein